MICAARRQLDFSCIYLPMVFIPNVCHYCNLTIFYDGHECVRGVLGNTIHS